MQDMKQAMTLVAFMGGCPHTARQFANEGARLTPLADTEQFDRWVSLAHCVDRIMASATVH